MSQCLGRAVGVVEWKARYSRSQNAVSKQEIEEMEGWKKLEEGSSF